MCCSLENFSTGPRIISITKISTLDVSLFKNNSLFIKLQKKRETNKNQKKMRLRNITKIIDL